MKDSFLYHLISENWIKVKWFIQRGQRGWSDCDAWNLCDYNARIMSEALKYLSKNCNGYKEGYTFIEWKAKLHNTSFMFKSIIQENLPHKDRNRIFKELTDTMKKDYFDWWD